MRKQKTNKNPNKTPSCDHLRFRSSALKKPENCKLSDFAGEQTTAALTVGGAAAMQTERDIRRRLGSCGHQQVMMGRAQARPPG